MRPRIGVSACLLGQPVRYDGAARPQAWILDTLARHAELVPLCPEAGAGLGVPRPPVRLVETAAGIRALGVEDPALDVTGSLESWCGAVAPQLEGLQAVVLKSRSPSCGLGSVPVHSPEGLATGTGAGLFAAYLAARHPGLVLVEETELEEAAGRQAFARALGIRL